MPEIIGLLPVSSLYIALNLILAVLLAINVVRIRAKYKIDMLHGDNIEMLKKLRAHGNNVEYVPYALIGLIALEVMGTGSNWLHGLGIALTTARVFHAQGLYRSTGTSVGRFVGTTVTWLVMLLIAVLLLMKVFG